MELVFKNIQDICYEKSIDKKYLDGSFSKAENVCVKRCGKKYLSAVESISKHMQDMGARSESREGQ